MNDLIEIRLDENNQGPIKLNGQLVHAVRAITFEASAGLGNLVTLTLINCKVDIEAHAYLKKVEVDLK